MQEKIDKLESMVLEMSKQLDTLKNDYYYYNFPTLQVFKKDVSLEGKVGFFNSVPVSKQSAITTPSGGGGGPSDAVDITARTAIGQIKTALQNIGITS